MTINKRSTTRPRHEPTVIYYLFKRFFPLQDSKFLYCLSRLYMLFINPVVDFCEQIEIESGKKLVTF